MAVDEVHEGHGPNLGQRASVQFGRGNAVRHQLFQAEPVIIEVLAIHGKPGLLCPPDAKLLLRLFVPDRHRWIDFARFFQLLFEHGSQAVGFFFERARLFFGWGSSSFSREIPGNVTPAGKKPFTRHEKSAAFIASM